MMNKERMKSVKSSRMERYMNPKIVVKSENLYSVVGKPEYFSKEKPFFRYKKYKDERGIYIKLDRRRRVYESN